MANPQALASPLPSEVFVKEIAGTRRRKQLSQQQLADRLEAIGAPIDRSTIGKIEAGHRGVSLDELFFFAVALGVSPMSLVVPRSAERMRVAPSKEIDATDVMQWARNFTWLPGEEADVSEIRFFNEAVTDLEAEGYRRHPGLRTMVGIIGLMLGAAGKGDRRATSEYRKHLVYLADMVQRDWKDLGEKGDIYDLLRTKQKEG
jgi:transcriptional regulator with XRE-family HTH domain